MVLDQEGGITGQHSAWRIFTSGYQAAPAARLQEASYLSGASFPPFHCCTVLQKHQNMHLHNDRQESCLDPTVF